jgi:hypothetical protein
MEPADSYEILIHVYVLNYQESSWGLKGGRPARKVDNLTAICEPIV